MKVAYKPGLDYLLACLPEPSTFCLKYFKTSETGGSAGPLFPPGSYAYGRIVEDQRRGIRWTLFSTHEDLDFADDLALLSDTWPYIQEKTDRVSIFSDQVGLTIILKKTEAMRVNVPSPTVIGVRGHGIPYTNKFTYLGSALCQDGGTGVDK